MSKKSPVKSGSRALRKKRPAAKQARAIEQHDVAALKRELAEALEQQAATSEILRVIASSPTEIQPVLDTVVQSAARLCEANDAVIFRVDGDVLQRVAIYGPIPIRAAPIRIGRGSVTGRAVFDREAVHIRDIDAESEAEFPDIDKSGARGGSRVRTRLAVPLLDRKSTRLNSSHIQKSRMPSSA